MRGKRRSRQDYKALFAELERSGLSLYAFARKEGLAYSTLLPWRRRFEDEARKAEAKAKRVEAAKAKKAKTKAVHLAPQFLPVSLEDAGLGFSSQRESCEVRLRSGHELRVPSGFDPVTLCALLNALESSSCSR